MHSLGSLGGFNEVEKTHTLHNLDSMSIYRKHSARFKARSNFRTGAEISQNNNKVWQLWRVW